MAREYLAKLSLSKEAFDDWFEYFHDSFEGRLKANFFDSERGRSWWSKALGESLDSCEPAAAVVVAVNPALVAVYTERLDAVAMLRFEDDAPVKKPWALGARLLFVNEYVKAIGFAADSTDLVRGERATDDVDFYFPICAELMTDDQARVEELKDSIPEEIWQRCEELGNESASRKQLLPRDGQPLNSQLPGRTSWDKLNQRNKRRIVQDRRQWKLNSYYLPRFILALVIGFVFALTRDFTGRPPSAFGGSVFGYAILPFLIIVGLSRLFFDGAE